MNRSQAYNEFWNSFGWVAYDEYTIPDEKDLPKQYIVYNFASDSLDADIALHVTLWERDTSSWKQVALKADEISEAIYRMEKPIEIDTGYMWIKKGNPFAARVDDDTDDNVKGYYLNITVEFLTAY